MNTSTSHPTEKVLHGYAQLLAQIDTPLFEDGVPEPWKGIGERLRQSPFENRLELFKKELGQIQGTDVDAILVQIATTDPTAEPTDECESDQDAVAIPAAMPFPVDALPPALGDLVAEGSKAIGCPPDYIALPLLTCAGAAIGTSACIEVKPGWSEFPLLYTAFVGPSGAKKTPAKKLAVRFTTQKGLEYARQYELELANYEKLREAHEFAVEEKRSGRGSKGEPLPEAPRRPVLKRTWVSDTTVEALGLRLSENLRGLVLVRDELSALPFSMNQYKGGHGGDQQFFLSAWSSDPLQIDRKKESDSLSIPQPFLAITGGIQPGVLQKALGSGRLDDGFTARFLFCYPEVPPLVVSEEVVDLETIARAEFIFDQLYGLSHRDPYSNPQEPQIVYLTSEARADFVVWENDNNKRIETLSEDDPFRYPLSKVPGQLARTALILHCIRCVSGECERFDELDQSTMRAAIRIADYFVSHARRVWSRLVESREDTQMRVIVNWMKTRRAPVSARLILRNGVGGFKTAAELTPVLQRMLDCELIVPAKIGKVLTYSLKVKH